MSNAAEYLLDARFQASKPGLDRTRHLLECLGNPQKKLKFVHVAGTNGKGSVCACLSAVLAESGYKTGLYISPYVLCYNERYQINGAYITDAELKRELELLRPYVEAMEDTPTQFEIETVLAIDYFYRSGCDIAILEVGMGGQWDSTNVIDAPALAVMCAVALDHCAILGETVAEIAAVKAGIIKPGCRAVMYDLPDSDAGMVIAEKCAQNRVPLFPTDFSSLSVHSCGLDGCRFDFGSIRNAFLPLSGTYQPRNAALAINALCTLRSCGWDKISDESILSGFSKVYCPGRFECLRTEPVFILDGTHNPHGMSATVASLKEHFNDRRITFVVSVMADKDVRGIFDQLAPFAERFITVEAPNARAMKPADLADLLSDYGAEVFSFDSIADGVSFAINSAGKDGVVVAIGTLYFSNNVRTAVMRTLAPSES